MNLPPQGLGQFNGAFGAALLGLRRVERLLAEGRDIPAPGGEGAAEHGIHAVHRWSAYVPATQERVASAHGTTAGVSLIKVLSSKKGGQHGRISQAIE